MLRKSLLLPALLAVLYTVPGRAESFFGFRSGYYAISSKGEIRDLFQGFVEPSEFNGGTAGLHAVRYFTPNLAAELSIDAFIPEVDFSIELTSDPDDAVPVNAALGLFPIGLSARYRLYPERITPVGIAGLSLVPYRFEIASTLFPDIGVDQSGVRLGYQLGVGAEVPFGLRWMVTSELLYRGVDFETSFLNNDGTLLEFKPNFSGFQLLVGLAYAF